MTNREIACGIAARATERPTAAAVEKYIAQSPRGRTARLVADIAGALDAKDATTGAERLDLPATATLDLDGRRYTVTIGHGGEGAAYPVWAFGCGFDGSGDTVEEAVAEIREELQSVPVEDREGGEPIDAAPASADGA